MFSTVINIKFKPGKIDEAVELSRSAVSKLEGVPGIIEYTVINTGDDSAAVFVIYDSKDDWEAAAPKAQEILGGFADLVAAAPERAGGDVVVNHIF